MSDGIVKVSQILVLAGIFFLVMAFLHILPSMFMHNTDNAGPNADMPHHTEYRAAILARLTGKGI